MRLEAIGQRSETVRRANLSAIVCELHAGGPLSRSELVGTTGLTLHVAPEWLAIGASGALVAGILAIWGGVRSMSRRSARSLLTSCPSPDTVSSDAQLRGLLMCFARLT